MADSTPPSQVQTSASNTKPNVPPSRYHGVSLHNGKWKAEVYSWHHSKTIWLGLYATPEMAAITYDVGALAYNGGNAVFNFPDALRLHPVLKTTSITHVRAAATEVATQYGLRPKAVDASEVTSQEIGEYVDEDELFYMPQVLTDMAEGLMISPPRLGPPEHYEPLEVVQDDNLWNFDD
ncbi:ethylene-responsive transcription factor ERF026-like [Dendrobium catenatum]|uniref:Ethylene-responsive transcription factor ERF026 n=1 Tax=Dendrobium catenatum TaxID=906689 RepID=A0A2I0VJQ2_9ASPA|nr:ethylene-responsive transcription factor ERF026-like [Dendrobium catenatum]PKU63640.1 Ethylene-responsive transcription factor ERF026 [Dendrobium catenatum]